MLKKGSVRLTLTLSPLLHQLLGLNLRQGLTAAASMPSPVEELQ